MTQSRTHEIKEKKATHIMPEKTISPKEVITPSEAIVPIVDVSKAEREELEKIEAEMKIEKKKYFCIVHKGPIKEDNIYLCPNCDTFYCVRCARALKEKGEKCWSCDSEITITVPDEVKEKIQQLESQIDSLKTTAQNLDENYYAKAISKEEYYKMKDSLAEKITELMRELNQLKDEDTT